MAQARIHLSSQQFYVRFMILPILINVILAALTQVILRSTRISKVQKNASVCMYIVLICVNVQCTHYVFGMLSCLAKAFRYGGEEIMILMWDMKTEEAWDVVESMPNNFRRMDYDFLESQHMTFSAGVGIYETGLTIHGWIDKTDKLLYQAKNSGKNRMIVR